MYVKGSCSLTTHVLSKILRLLYMYTMVGYLFQNDDTIYVRFSVSHVYLQSFLLHDIRAFFCHVYLRFIPKYMTIFLQTRIYMRTKKVHIYALQTSMCIWVTESRRIRGTELYRQQKTPSCTMTLKSNFSLI